VFVSSHLLAEVQVLADVVGIIARGRLVREGPLETLLADQGVVRVQVGQPENAAARAVLERLASVDSDPPGGTPGAAQPVAAPAQWLTVHVPPARAAEVNRLLAEAGIYASGLESGTDLELLFLELTGGEASSEGRMQGIGTPDAGAPPS
jgi:ABC-2 type transport system ATP-binding protein